jgi:hypothetical protein
MRMPKSRVLVPIAVAAAAASLLAAGLMGNGAALGQPTDVEVVEAPPAPTPIPTAAPIQVTAPEPRPPASPPEVPQPAVGPESAQAPAQQLPSAGTDGLQGGFAIPLIAVSLLATGWALTVLGAAMTVAGRFRYKRG